MRAWGRRHHWGANVPQVPAWQALQGHAHTVINMQNAYLRGCTMQTNQRRQQACTTSTTFLAQQFCVHTRKTHLLLRGRAGHQRGWQRREQARL